MLYEFPFTIPKNTTKSNPKIKHVKLERGLIDLMGVEFPPGCGGDVGVRIFHDGFQLSPKNTDSWHVSDDFVVEHRPYYELFTEPYELAIHGYNQNSENDHTPIVRISLQPEKELQKYVIPQPVVPRAERIPIPVELI